MGAIWARTNRSFRIDGDDFSRFREVGQRVGEHSIAVASGVLVSKGGCRGRVARSVHQLGSRGPRRSRERKPGMAEVMVKPMSA